ncbi:MAG: Sec-independent protein translocase subunit TatB [Oxalobacteraceae bacterium]|nr:Sec-independent protein translocase subunit TatB [Oxalobacteraceae bacterium]
MIDLGLSKLALIGAVALVVIGPEKLPAVARMVGTLFGRAQRYINNVKAEVNREMQMEELQKMQTNFVDAATKLNSTFSSEAAEVRKEVDEAGKELSDSLHQARQSFDALWEFDAKRREFRRKRMSHTSMLPLWYKRQHGLKTRVQSGAARVARYRPASGKSVKFFH